MKSKKRLNPIVIKEIDTTKLFSGLQEYIYYQNDEDEDQDIFDLK